jgi:ribonucleotide reductase alpha subunit
MVDQLNKGDMLMVNNGEFANIETIEIGQFEETDFIDFRIDKTHNFYVTGNGDYDELILSHNSGVKDGAMTTSLSSWHMDIFSFLKTQQLGGEEREKTMDIFLQLVANDEFMKAMKSDTSWYLFDPYEIKTKFNISLDKTFGEEFEKDYRFLVRTVEDDTITDPDKKIELFKKVRARDIFKEALRTTINRGTPYWAFKDNINRVSNMKEAGTIYGLNLCLTGDTKVHILIDNKIKKEVTLEELGKLYENDKTIQVLSKNIDTNELEYKLITDWFLTNHNAEVYEIEHPSGKIIRCTSEHKIYTKNRGYVKASELLETDVLDVL